LATNIGFFFQNVGNLPLNPKIIGIFRYQAKKTRKKEHQKISLMRKTAELSPETQREI
jgi:hypothetical protein